MDSLISKLGSGYNDCATLGEGSDTSTSRVQDLKSLDFYQDLKILERFRDFMEI